MQLQTRSFSDSVLIVSGEALPTIMNNSTLKELFLSLVTGCKSVISFRMSPKQKADLVNFMKQSRPDKIVLAVGDGANDVAMITQAHIGVGISGVEGRQAVSASDYSVSEFQKLSPLILAHGRECYRRNSYAMSYTFYKNIVFCLPQFYFGWVSGWSGQTTNDALLTQVYNLFFTSWPIIIFAAMD